MDSESEAIIASYCREAKLSPLQTEVVLLHLLDRLEPPQIRLKLKNDIRRTADARALLAQGLAKLSGLEGFWLAAQQFERALVPCAENRTDYDERPDGLCGVTPDRSSQRFQGARMVSTGDRRLEQDLLSAATMWANNLRPQRVDVAAAAT